MEIGQIKDYLEQEIKYQQLLTSKLSKCLTGFGYANKILTVLLTAFSGTNNFAHVKGEKLLFRLITSVFSLLFCLSSAELKNCNKKQKQERKNTKNYCIWLKINLIVLKC